MIRELDEKGGMLVDLGDRKVRLDLKTYRQIDHAFAVTSHQSQGSTVEHSTMYAPVRPDKFSEKEIDRAHEEYGRTSYKALNVAVTRARFGTRVFIISIAGLTRSAEVVDGKTSTLTRLREPEHVLSRSILERNDVQPRRELRMKIENLERVMLRPEAGVRKVPSMEHVVSMLRASGHKLPPPVRGDIWGFPFRRHSVPSCKSEIDAIDDSVPEGDYSGSWSIEAGLAMLGIFSYTPHAALRVAPTSCVIPNAAGAALGAVILVIPVYYRLNTVRG